MDEHSRLHIMPSKVLCPKHTSFEANNSKWLHFLLQITCFAKLFADQTFAYIGNYMFSYFYKLGEALRNQINISMK